MYSTSKKDPSRPLTDNSIMRLPPELRNTIYELVLLKPSCSPSNDPTTYIRKRCSTKGNRTNFHTTWKDVVKSWREPTLLRVCKAIREETLGMYYKANTFELRITTAEFEKVYNFIRAKSVNPGIPMKWSIQITKAEWNDTPHMLHFAKLVYEFDANSTYGKITYLGCDTSQTDRAWPGAIEFQLDVVGVVRKCRDRGLPWKCVVEDFVDWGKAKVRAARVSQLPDYKKRGLYQEFEIQREKALSQEGHGR